MSMFYRSTRDDNVKVTASQAILKGLAADGGLFVPESIPSLDKSLEELSKMNYKSLRRSLPHHQKHRCPCL